MRRQHFFIAVRCVEISRSALATGPTPSPLKPIVISRCHTYYEEWRNHRTRPTPRLDLRYYQTDLPKACHEKLSDYFWPRLLITAVVCDIQRGWGGRVDGHILHTLKECTSRQFKFAWTSSIVNCVRERTHIISHINCYHKNIIAFIYHDFTDLITSCFV